jgi:hypothetical protein
MASSKHQWCVPGLVDIGRRDLVAEVFRRDLATLLHTLLVAFDKRVDDFIAHLGSSVCLLRTISIFLAGTYSTAYPRLVWKFPGGIPDDPKVDVKAHGLEVGGHDVGLDELERPIRVRRLDGITCPHAYQPL